MTYTLDNIKTAPSYDALKRNGFTDRDCVTYYNAPFTDRQQIFQRIKMGMTTQVSKTTTTVKGSLYSQVDSEFRRLMKTTFTVFGKTYNLVEMGYTFGWNNNKSRFGVHKIRGSRNRWSGEAIYHSKRIELSNYMMQHAKKTFEDWVDTILHEIAHGIDYAIRHDSNHDGHWVRVAKAIGCSGERCGNYKVEATKKYEASCKCGTPHTRHKLSRNTRYNSSCARCGTKLVWKQNF